jgi:2,3-bisphosphoglycerate-independent phosphoglycerate mutase
MHEPKLLIVVLDGVGAPNFELCTSASINSNAISTHAFNTGNAVNAAYMPTFFKLCQENSYRTLFAHGKHVGLPSNDDMGNSEVGHNALGAGRVFAQGAKLVNEAFETESIYKSEGWKETIARKELSSGINTLHLCGLLSDGNVHSHINHLFKLIEGAKKFNVKKVRLHLLLDGRDVGPCTAEQYEEKLSAFLEKINSQEFDCQVASGGGRTFCTMDRYESDWSIVERGYNAHVCGEGLKFESLKLALEQFRKEGKNFDQDLPPFVIEQNNKPLGEIFNNDSFILFNFRGDRAIQISRALTEENFTAFNRKKFPKIFFSGMMQYDGDLKIPAQFLVNPPIIENTMTEILSGMGVTQFACSETQKYGHVTYFWNGNRSEKFSEELENYIEIPSELVNFANKPWMKCAEITDVTIEQMKKNSFKVGRINYANGDMVGHTGHFAAAVCSLSALDLQLERLSECAKETNTILLITADHGNADEMYEIDKKTKLVSLNKQGIPKAKTSHTLAKVPCVLVFPKQQEFEFHNNLPDAGLANIAATVFDLINIQAPQNYEPSLICKKTTPTNILHEKKLNQPFNQQKFGFNNPIVENKLANQAIDFLRIIKALRSQYGCPWDKEQTFTSLQKHLIEECYEAIEASQELEKESINKKLKAEHMSEELGDILLQIFLNSQIASEENLFNVNSVFNSICEKIIRRHPHVFENQEAKNAAEAVLVWEEVKKKENILKEEKGLLYKASKEKYLPTLNYVCKISSRASKIGFSWNTIKDVFKDLESEVLELKQEVLELKQEVLENENSKIEDLIPKIKDEMGDVIFALSNIATWFNQKGYGIDLDICARQSAQKFLTRFECMENLFLQKYGKIIDEAAAKNLTLNEWNEFWKEAKKIRYN